MKLIFSQPTIYLQPKKKKILPLLCNLSKRFKDSTELLVITEARQTKPVKKWILMLKLIKKTWSWSFLNQRSIFNHKKKKQAWEETSIPLKGICKMNPILVKHFVSKSMKKNKTPVKTIWCKMHMLLKDSKAKNHTLSSTYPYSKYMGKPPSPRVWYAIKSYIAFKIL